MSANRVSIRKGLFTEIFGMLQRVLPEIFRNTEFDDEDERFLIDLFFMMSDSYKVERTKDGHFTNNPKKAALTVAAIMAMRPIRITASHAGGLRYFYANPTFAIACATAILKRPLYSEPDEDKFMFYGYLDTLRFPSTQSYVNDAQAQLTRPISEYAFRLKHTELAAIDVLAQRMATAARYFDLESQLHDQGDDA